MNAHQNNPSAGVRGSAPASLPILEIRFTPAYAWILMGAGGVFFLLSFLVGSKTPALGIFIAVLSVGAVFGGNYWRHHLHVVARMMPRQLVLQREGIVKWSEIAMIEKKTIHMRHKGVPHQSAYVCIKLKTPRQAADKLQGFLNKVKKVVLFGYDIVVAESELSCSADYFIAECRKRMVAVAGAA